MLAQALVERGFFQVCLPQKIRQRQLAASPLFFHMWLSFCDVRADEEARGLRSRREGAEMKQGENRSGLKKRQEPPPLR
jgi:hypothetical protein